MSSLAVIGTFYQRHENSLMLMKRLIVDSTRKPDEFWLMCEGQDDVEAIDEALDFLYEKEMIEHIPKGLRVIHFPTPKNGASYAVIPYSHKINYALARTGADLIVYLDNGSIPTDDK